MHWLLASDRNCSNPFGHPTPPTCGRVTCNLKAVSIIVVVEYPLIVSAPTCTRTPASTQAGHPPPHLCHNMRWRDMTTDRVIGWRSVLVPAGTSRVMATGPSEDLLWDYKPTPKWRTPDDPFFTEGNRVCQVTSKQIMTDMDEEVDAKSRSAEQIISMIVFSGQTGSQKIIPLSFKNVWAEQNCQFFEHCSFSDRSFPCKIAACQKRFSSAREWVPWCLCPTHPPCCTFDDQDKPFFSSKWQFICSFLVHVYLSQISFGRSCVFWNFFSFTGTKCITTMRTKMRVQNVTDRSQHLTCWKYTSWNGTTTCFNYLPVRKTWWVYWTPRKFFSSLIFLWAPRNIWGKEVGNKKYHKTRWQALFSAESSKMVVADSHRPEDERCKETLHCTSYRNAELWQAFCSLVIVNLLLCHFSISVWWNLAQKFFLMQKLGRII